MAGTVRPSGGIARPLGLQAPAERLLNEVLPGLTVFTSRAGYYAFLPWAIRHVNGLPPGTVPARATRHDLLNALERALLLTEFVHHGLDDDACRLIGQRSKLRILSGAQGDRYRVPESVLKNQNSAGSFRLFATSLISLGLVEESDDLLIDGLLPYRLTPRGEAIAGAFETRTPDSFAAFGLGDRTQPRFRHPILQGLLLGSSRDAEKRFRTVAHLFAEGLLTEEGLSRSAHTAPDTLSEDDAIVSEGSTDGAALSNSEIVLHFYALPPREDLLSLQAMAVFELLALGLSAIFRAALVTVTEAGKGEIDRLTISISTAASMAELWAAPLRNAKPPSMRKLVKAILETQDPIEAASLGGAILIRLVRDRLFPAVWDVLMQFAREPVELFDQTVRQQMDQSLAAALPGLLRAMVERHEMVSSRKNRQRWMSAEGDTLVRDDSQAMGLGFHALRFPQLGSLACDLRLTREDLRHG